MSEWVTYRDRRGRERRRRAALRVPGHKLTMTWSGEHGIESSSTGECSCGWTESASNQREVRREYRHHLAVEQAKQEVGTEDTQAFWARLREIEGRA